MPGQILPVSGLTPEGLAAFARLRYVCDQDPGFRRQRNGKGFYYLDAGGRRVRDTQRIARFETLAIPPAWQDVWICRYAKGHLQATGRDSRHRKQYVYHPRWSEVSNLAKFIRLSALGKTLPALRRAVAMRLKSRRLDRERLLAGIVGLLDATGVRIGHEEYVTQNNSFGLTTLRDRHVTVGRKSIELNFVGKGGFRKQAIVDQPALVRLVKQARLVPGAHLFQYVDDCGRRRAITAGDVNDFLRELTGQPFTAKDFRTWKASAQVAGTLYGYRDLLGVTKRRRMLKTVINDAAALLGNTPTVCRSYYIHPGLLATYQDGTFGDHVGGFVPRGRLHFGRDEQILQRFLKSWSRTPTAQIGAAAR